MNSKLQFDLIEPEYKYMDSSNFSNMHNENRRILRQWYATSDGFVLKDPWLYALLNHGTCFVYGVFDSYNWKTLRLFKADIIHNFAINITKHLPSTNKLVIISWYGSSYDKFDEYHAEFTEPLLSSMVKEGIMNRDMISTSQFLFSVRSDIEFANSRNESLNNPVHWHQINGKNPERHCFESHTDSFESQTYLRQLFDSLQTCFISSKTDTPALQSFKQNILIYFTAELQIKTVKEPESTLAKIWKECLGSQIIPFDPVARGKLIEQGKKHPELKLHIKKWQVMKCTGSKWVTGER